MSVQSVKNTVLKQSVANPVTGAAQVASDAGSEFTDLLQQIGSSFRTKVDSTVGGGGLTAAIKQNDAANAQAQNDAPRDKADSKSGGNSDKSAQRSDDVGQRSARAPRKVERQDAAEKADNSGAQPSEASSEDVADTVSLSDEAGESLGLDVAVDAGMMEDPAMLDLSAAMIDPAQMAQMVGPQVVKTQGPVQVQGQQAQTLVAAGPQQVDLGPQNGFQDDLAGAQSADTISLALQGNGAKNAQALNGATGIQQQAEDLAQRLDDPATQFQVSVSVTNQAKVTDVAAVAQQVAVQSAVGDDAALQEAAMQAKAQQLADVSASTAQGPVAATPLAQQNSAALGSPMAVVLAAQAEALSAADNAQPLQTNNNQAAQPLAGVGAASSTQASSKPQATHNAQATRMPVPPKPEELTEQIAVQITQNKADGTDTIKVQLKPVELGAVEVKMDVAKDGTVNAVVTVDSQETLDLMKKDQQGLEKALQDAGLKTENGSLTFNLRGEGQQQNAQDNNRQPRRSRLSVAAAADAAQAQSAAQAQARWTSRSGVNISV